MTNKAFRFGVVTAGHTTRSSWIALAQRVEELGYSTLLVPDVLGTPLAALTALTVARPMTTEQVVEHLLAQRKHLGISYIQIQERQLENFAPVLARLNGQ